MAAHRHRGPHGRRHAGPAPRVSCRAVLHRMAAPPPTVCFSVALTPHRPAPPGDGGEPEPCGIILSLLFLRHSSYPLLSVPSSDWRRLTQRRAFGDGDFGGRHDVGPGVHRPGRRLPRHARMVPRPAHRRKHSCPCLLLPNPR